MCTSFLIPPEADREYGSAVNSSNGAWGKNPAANEFGAFSAYGNVL